MKIEGYAHELADFFALDCFSSVYFKLTIESMADNNTNGDATIAELFSPPCRPTWKLASKENPIRFHGSLSGTEVTYLNGTTNHR